jgi:hypothetical protein
MPFLSTTDDEAKSFADKVVTAFFQAGAGKDIML